MILRRLMLTAARLAVRQAANNPAVRKKAADIASQSLEAARPGLLKGARKAGEVTRAAKEEIRKGKQAFKKGRQD